MKIHLPLVLLALMAAPAACALLPRDLGPVRIERVRLLPAGAPDGGREPAYLATPVRIAVTFVVPEDRSPPTRRLTARGNVSHPRAYT